MLHHLSLLVSGQYLSDLTPFYLPLVITSIPQRVAPSLFVKQQMRPSAVLGGEIQNDLLIKWNNLITVTQKAVINIIVSGTTIIIEL